jgi:integrase
MPRATRDAKLDSRTAREKLLRRKKPYFRLIDPELHIGYYAGANGGRWVGRRYLRRGLYETCTVGVADDGRDANGVDVLTFAQAQNAVRSWAKTQAQRGAGTPDPTPLTVREAVKNYLADYSGRGGKARTSVEGTFNAHVLPALGDRLVADLTGEALRHWHHALAAAPARLRTKATATKRNTRPSTGADDDRARRATANSVLNLLRAALNFAFRDGKVPTDAAWRRVRPFPKVDGPRIRYLADDESRRLVNACPPDLRALVVAALLTGARYAELAAVRPRDFDASATVLTIAASKSGSARSIVLTDEAVEFFTHASVGRPRGEAFLLRADGSKWAKSFQFRPLRAACVAAKIEPAISFHILRHSYASRLARGGVPMAVIAAQLGHSDQKITARHYAHLSPGYVSDTVRNAFGRMDIVQDSVVTPLPSAGASKGVAIGMRSVS